MGAKPVPIKEADNETFELRLMVDAAMQDGQIDEAEARNIAAQVHLLEPLVHTAYRGFRVLDSYFRYGHVSPQIYREFGPDDTDPTDDGAPQLRAA